MKKLVLITRRFPYYTTEAFLETEIKFLAQHFDEISIYPSQIGILKREVPKNVNVIDDFSFHFQNKVKRFFQTIFSCFFWKSILDYKERIKSIKDVFLLFKYSSSFVSYSKFFLNQRNILDSSIVYTYWLNEAPHAFINLRSDNDFDFKIVSRAHRFDIYEGLDSTISFWPYRAFVLKKIDSVYSISNDGKKYLEDKYFSSKIAVAKLGVIDLGGISIRSEKGSFSIVSVSRVEPLKRVDLIFRSICDFAQLHNDLNVKWVHFGDGSVLSKIESEVALIKHPNLDVQLMGNVENSQIYRYYKTSTVDLFINLSSSEGIPVSIMEAQSFGIPVMATNVGGSGEIVNNNNGVLLVSDPTINDVVEGMDRIINSNFTQSIIKTDWNVNFNAEKNYSDFTKSLLLS
jgi:glycosyltransferase involved in cell wall biosynthesis